MLKVVIALALSTVSAEAVYAAAGETTPVGMIATIPFRNDSDRPIEIGGISRDGRYVVFKSFADDPVTGDNNGRFDVYLFDAQTQTTLSISTPYTSGGTDQFRFAAAPSISGDGRYVAWLLSTSDTTGEVMLYDRIAGSSQSVQTFVGGGTLKSLSHVHSTALSDTGRYLAYATGAPASITGGAGNHTVKLLDRETGTLTAIAENAPAYFGGWDPRPGITADGSEVVFQSVTLGRGDANYVSHIAGELGGDIFAKNVANGAVERISVNTQGAQATAECFSPSVTPDGRYVVFESTSSNLAPPQETFYASDVFLRDRRTGATERLSVNNDGVPGNARSYSPTLSADGRYVIFASQATNLVPDDTNGVADTFVYDRQTHTIERISVASNGQQGDGQSTAYAISADGRIALFGSNAALSSTPGANLFLHERAAVAAESVWRSYDVSITGSSPQATVESFDGRNAAVEFYESTDDGGISKDLLFGSYAGASHADTFNHVAQFWSNDGLYPYAGKSTLGRGADSGESNVEVPYGVRDLQLHPASNAHLTVAAFIAPESGHYSVSHLAVRRTDSNGETVRLHLFNAQGVELANLQASNDRGWVRSTDTYDLGQLSAGDRIYFGVGADGGYDYDATEIAWEIKSSEPPQLLQGWDSYDRDDLLPVDYYESADIGGVAQGPAFNTTVGAHPDGFNHLLSYRSAGGDYPYAGRSSVLRGSDTGESNAIPPLDVNDIQMHPPADGHSAVAAFRVPVSGIYTVSDLAARRVDVNGQTVRLRLVNSQGVEVATLPAGNDQAWVRSPQTYNLGVLNPGDSIYFAVDNDGDYSWDATEIAWRIQASAVTP